VTPGNDEPVIATRPPGPQSRTWLLRFARSAAPMGPSVARDTDRRIVAEVPGGTIVSATAKGSNVLDVDGNRFVDLAGGFGAILLGHAHPRVLRVIELQSQRLLQALGDVYPSDARIALTERLAGLYPRKGARVILGQSGSDAVSAALKTAVLATGKPGVLAFRGGYHGLGYGPLAASGFRDSYREPFAAQLNPHVCFVDFPDSEADADACLERARFELSRGDVGAVVVEPILGRGGCIVPPDSFLPELGRLARASGALWVADEIWTGLGRSGHMLYSSRGELVPDLICLGKGLGGGLPISACIGSEEVMATWRRDREVVHTSTFAGAPLACATAIATLDVLRRDRLDERARQVGARWRDALSRGLVDVPRAVRVRGEGLMVGIDLGDWRGGAATLARWLLERGYIVSTGGTNREVLVLTPSLTIAEELLDAFVQELRFALQACSP
jgi:4-aminobutyrate aminotransferase / (S)-3-amino-2-methylpropionate transaminase / 5-aminovalerate transaminase